MTGPSRRFQIFVSSTYDDLVEERRAVFDHILCIPHIPIGMEHFRADDDQWAIIEATLDESDFYVLILGEKYGWRTENGTSFTEREFDYAAAKGVPLMAIVKEDVFNKVKADDTSVDPQLAAFYKKAMKGRMVKFWSDKNDLCARLATFLPRLIRAHESERAGWVRGDALQQLSALSEENIGLKAVLSGLRTPQLGLTNAYRHRQDCRNDLMDDLARSNSSCRMYAAVYVSEIHKSGDFDESIRAACERAQARETTYTFSFTSLDPADRAGGNSILEAWSRREDKSAWGRAGFGKQDPIVPLRHRINRAHDVFDKLLSGLSSDRLPVNARASYFENYLCPHSMVIIDDRIVYLGLYEWLHSTGTDSPAIRIDGGDWARVFVREADQIDQFFSKTRQSPPP
jgi:hypothetical protein